MELGKFGLGPTWFWPHYEKLLLNSQKNWVWRHLINLTNNKGRMLLERSQHETPQQRLLPDEAMEPSLRFVGGVQSMIEAISATLP
ncbi:hypothetical protein ACTP13_25850 [Paenibacillus peoriae]